MPSLLQENEETAIDRLLRTQQTLDTPVTHIAREHDDLVSGMSAARSRFQELIPLSAPGAGQQYAFDVDLDACTGCKACVSACHSMNGLEDNEIWREVGLIKGGTVESPFLQTVTTACHHCADPACLNGCPVNAYEKDPITGIVLHLDDQCIGCQYCVLKCPYDVPKYSQSLGIVRKCDMCHGRLAEGEAPACVQACPNEAIKITTITVAEIPRPAASETSTTFPIPDTVDFNYTVPTTRYHSRRPNPITPRAADAASPQPQHAHWPLVLMLVWTQASVGALAAALFTSGLTAQWLLLIATASCAIGLAASTLHLGKPLKAWRAFLGLRHSWLSREIVVFGAYFPLLATAALLPLAPNWMPPLPAASLLPLGALATGLLGVFCSVMIYHDTRRAFWHLPRSAGKFFGSAWVLGSAAALFATHATGLPALIPTLSLLLGSVVKLLLEACIRRPGLSTSDQAIAGSALLIERFFVRTFARRLVLGMIGGIVLPLAAFAVSHGLPATLLAAGAFACCMAGELHERYLYFRAVIGYKMPGGIHA